MAIQFKGTGIPNASSLPEQQLPRCGVDFTPGSCRGGSHQYPGSLAFTIDVGLDRDSFLQRGWTNEDLGAWDGGTGATRRGLFLSMFFALQNRNPHTQNPWDEAVHDWDRGLSAHLDAWISSQAPERYKLYVYDHLNLPPQAAFVTGRNRAEAPFANLPEVVYGVAGGGKEVFVRADYPSWALGARIDAPVWIEHAGRHHLNATYALAHLFGHFLGMPHYPDPVSLMNCALSGNPRPQWQTPIEPMQRMFKVCANHFYPRDT